MSLRTLLSVLVCATLLACCAHVPRQPPTSGYFGIIKPGKPVYCASTPDDDSGLSTEQCYQLRAQVDVINRAVGYELLHWAGWMELHSGKDIPKECVDVILVGRMSLPGSIIGLTMPRCMENGYIRGTIILFDPAIWDNEAIEHPEAVVLHELLHALGLGHADKDGAFASIMEPSYQPDVTGLTASDLASLKAVY